ncbi:hypothetical protein BJV78DRAFT_1156053 [Lactifluus subvellereus]|nr:hypothetical protein BJV78DRAFT_1156053 [Lactifluus subvellereus]
MHQWFKESGIQNSVISKPEGAASRRISETLGKLCPANIVMRPARGLPSPTFNHFPEVQSEQGSLSIHDTHPSTPSTMMSFSTCSLSIYWTSGMNTMVAMTALSPPTGDRRRSWYKLAQVCRQWRHLILVSSNCLGLHHVCTMLAHPSPFPLIIIYLEKDQMTIEVEQSILIALGPEYRDRYKHDTSQHHSSAVYSKTVTVGRCPSIRITKLQMQGRWRFEDNVPPPSASVYGPVPPSTTPFTWIIQHWQSKTLVLENLKDIVMDGVTVLLVHEGLWLRT